MDTNVISLPARLDHTTERIHRSAQAVAEEMRYYAFGEAYLRAVKFHPEVTDPHEFHDLVMRIAVSALYMGAKRLAEDAPSIATKVALPA